jgi:hypothetical protein
MARSPKTTTPAAAATSAAPTIDPETVYQVTLTRPVPYHGRVLRPRDDIRMKGAMIIALGDAIASAEPV